MRAVGGATFDAVDGVGDIRLVIRRWMGPRLHHGDAKVIGSFSPDPLSLRVTTDRGRPALDETLRPRLLSMAELAGHPRLAELPALKTWVAGLRRP